MEPLPLRTLLFFLTQVSLENFLLFSSIWPESHYVAKAGLQFMAISCFNLTGAGIIRAIILRWKHFFTGEGVKVMFWEFLNTELENNLDSLSDYPTRNGNATALQIQHTASYL